MDNLTENEIDAMAPNANAIANGRKLFAQGKFQKLCITDDDSIVFGTCSGSGSKPYYCSVDFINPQQPTSRCSCPSRQFPCKHCLGLLYARVGDADAFVKEALPQDIADKRDKAVKRAEKKKENEGKPKQPRKVNLSALKKKLQAQLESLDLLEQLLLDMLNQGLGSHGQKEAASLKEKAVQLKANQLQGAELAIRRLSHTIQCASQSRQFGGRDNHLYYQAMDEIACLEALIRRGRSYLSARLEDPELNPETDSSIAAWLGHAWRLDELRDAGLAEPACELVQLSFFIRDDSVKAEFADTGIWLHLGDQRIFYTETMRPYRSTGHIKGDDSVFSVGNVSEFLRYPGQMPTRIRWDGMEPVRQPNKTDYATIRSASASDFDPVMKSIRAALKEPLGSRYPLALLTPHRIGRIGDDVQAPFVIEDKGGTRIELANAPEDLYGAPPTCQMMPLLGEQLTGSAILCLFHLDFATLRLTAQPLTFIHENSMTRLAF